MAAASRFAALLLGPRPRNPTASVLPSLLSSSLLVSRAFSSSLSSTQGLAAAEEDTPPQRRRPPDDDLFFRILRLRIPKRSAASALEQWVSEEREVTPVQLRQIVKEFRRKERYKHALEIFTWMDSSSHFPLSSSDHADRLDLILKVSSVVEAESYFARLQNSASRRKAALPLLHYYAKARDLQKAEILMMTLQNSGLAVDSHPFNEMMKLYTAIGQFETVSKVIQYMKRSKIPLNVLSYNLWMNACCKVSGVGSVEMILEQMKKDKNAELGWSTYSTIANIYVTHGVPDKAYDALRVAEGLLSTRKRLAYTFIMTIYAALKDRDGVLRLWEASKKVAGKITCANYMCAMLCLLKVGDIREAEKLFRTWELERRNYDVRVSNVLLGAYMRNGWVEKAEMLHLHTLQNGASPNYKTWEILMEGWVNSREMEKAVEAMKKGLSMLNGCHWRPSNTIIMSIAEYFEAQGNLEEMTRYVKLLQGLGLMTLPLYKSFLRVHIKTNRVAPDVLGMIGRDQIDLDEEAVTLIQFMTRTSNREDAGFLSLIQT